MLSYGQKQNIINHLADKSRWTHHDLDMAWLENPARRYSQGIKDGIIYTLISRFHVILQDSKTNAFLEIDFTKHRIRDENGKDVFFDPNGKYYWNEPEKLFRDPEKLGVSLGPIHFETFKSMPGRRVDLDFGCITVVFLESGAKNIFFHELSYVAHFGPSPDALRAQGELKALYKQHSISFPSEMLNGPGIDEVKLVIAFDFAVEPRLKAVNSLHNAGYFSRDLKPEPWNDSTEFTGHYIDVPFNYRVETTKNGFDVYTDSDRRDWIITNAQLTQRAFEMAASPWKTNTNLRSEDIIAGIESGTRVKAPDGSDWRMSTYRTEYAHLMAYIARHYLSKEMDMSGRDYLAVNHAEDMFVLGAKEEKLQAMHERTKAAPDNSRGKLIRVPGIDPVMG
ncbi:MAG: hypothetical protein WBK55_06210 [Alphaproteobacteria bacterium]